MSLKSLRPMIIVLAALVTGASQQQEADTEILLGGILLRLEMHQDDALRSLSAVYEVKHQDHLPGTWVVLRRGGPSSGYVGTVTFRDQTLVSVNKNWGPDDTSEQSLARALYDAVQSVTSGDSRNCNISGQAFPDVGWQTEIRCGRRTLSVFAGADGRGSAVGETLSLTP